MSDQAPTTCTLVGFGTIATHTSQRRKKLNIAGSGSRKVGWQEDNKFP